MKRTSIASIVIAALTMMGCSSNDVEEQATGQLTPIRLTSNVSQTRSANTQLQQTQLVTGVEAGVFVKNVSGYITGGNNSKQTADGAGGFNGNAIYFPADGSAVSVYAYAPYNIAWDDQSTTAVDFTVAADQSTDAGYLASDLLCGAPDGTNSFTKETETVALRFAHKLTKVNVKFSVGEGVDLKGATVSLLNILPTTTLQVESGTLGAAKGTATAIKVATFADDATAFVGSAVVVPQTIAAGNFLQVKMADGRQYVAPLSADVTFESGKVYTYQVTIGQRGIAIVLSSIITDWDSSTEGLSGDAIELVTYEVGDYVLKDGSLLKNSKVNDSNKDNIIAVIFSTTVSETDAAAGYSGYAMGVKRIGASGGAKKQWYVNTSYGLGVGSIADAMADLDGLTKAQAIRANSIYTALSDNSKHVANLSDYLVEKTGANLSEWYTPSYGQLVKMLNNLGNAGITAETVTRGWSAYNPFYESANDANATNIANVFAAINAYTQKAGRGDIITVGNIDLGTLTENSGANGEKVFQFEVKSAGNWNLTAAQAKVGSSGVKEVCVIPVVAYKQ